MTDKIKMEFAPVTDKTPVKPDKLGKLDKTKKFLKAQVKESTPDSVSQGNSLRVSEQGAIESTREEAMNLYPPEKVVAIEQEIPFPEQKPPAPVVKKENGVLKFFNDQKKKLFMTLGFLTIAGAATATNNNSAEKMFSDSTANNISKSIEEPLKPGEKYRIIRDNMEVAGIKIEGRLLIPTSDANKEVYLVKFSGEGDNLIGRELEALKALGLKPADSKFLNEISPEAFKAAGSGIKAIDATYKEGENLGQSKRMMVKENTVIMIKNQVRIQPTEVKEMNKYGTTFEYATLAYKDKENKKAEYGNPDLAKNK